MHKVKLILLIAVFLIISVAITNFNKTAGGGIYLPYGWIGMYAYLRQMGIPFSWRTVCPDNPSGIPTGCTDGLNILAFSLNVICYTLILLTLTKLITFLIKMVINKIKAASSSRQGFASIAVIGIIVLVVAIGSSFGFYYLNNSINKNSEDILPAVPPANTTPPLTATLSPAPTPAPSLTPTISPKFTPTPISKASPTSMQPPKKTPLESELPLPSFGDLKASVSSHKCEMNLSPGDLVRLRGYELKPNSEAVVRIITADTETTGNRPDYDIATIKADSIGAFDIIKAIPNISIDGGTNYIGVDFEALGQRPDGGAILLIYGTYGLPPWVIANHCLTKDEIIIQ